MASASGIDCVQNCNDGFERVVKGQKRDFEVELNSDISRVPQTQFMRFDADKFLRFACSRAKQAHGVPNSTSHAFEKKGQQQTFGTRPDKTCEKKINWNGQIHLSRIRSMTLQPAAPGKPFVTSCSFRMQSSFQWFKNQTQIQKPVSKCAKRGEKRPQNKHRYLESTTSGTGKLGGKILAQDVHAHTPCGLARVALVSDCGTEGKGTFTLRGLGGNWFVVFTGRCGVFFFFSGAWGPPQFLKNVPRIQGQSLKSFGWVRSNAPRIVVFALLNSSSRETPFREWGFHSENYFLNSESSSENISWI